MKKNFDLLPLFGLATLLFLSACEKSTPATNPTLGPLKTAPSGPTPKDSVPVVLITDSQAIPPPVLPKAPAPQQTAPANSCPSLPIYGDSLVYPQPTNGTDYVITPINNPGPGKYLSWPVGMVIDSISGAIDLTASQTGMQYLMGYVKSGTTDTCLSRLYVGGASYADSVYNLQENQTNALPYFDGNPNLLNVCQNGNKCSFDVTGSAAAMHVVVNTSNGQIDLKKTLEGTTLLGGAFGLIPVNGQTITTTIYYKLNDPSNDALQNISVQLVYYDSQSLINIGLLNNILNKLDNLISGNPISLSTNPRPPLVVIVRHN